MLCAGEVTSRLFAKQDRDFLRCSNCGLVWIDPMPAQGERSDFYEEAYSQGHYVDFASASVVRQAIAQHRLEQVQSAARPGRWLDVGCAAGDFLAAAKKAGIQAEGLEISQTAVEQARGRELCAHRSAVEDFEPASAYDAITAFDVIEHLLDPRRFLERVHGWLVPGGTVALTLPDIGGWLPRALRRHWFYYWPDDHLYYFDRHTIARLLGDTGFRLLHLETAHKILTLDYASENLRSFNPLLGAAFAFGVRWLPPGLRTRPIRVSLGELFVVAQRVDP